MAAHHNNPTIHVCSLHRENYGAAAAALAAPATPACAVGAAAE